MQKNYHQDNEFIVPSELKIPTDPLNYKDLPALYQPYNSIFSFLKKKYSKQREIKKLTNNY